MEAGFHRESLLDNSHLAETLQQPSKLANAVLEEHGRVLVFQRDLHQLRERIQPGDPVVHLENGLTARLQNPPAFIDEPLRVRRVLDDAVRVYQIERVVRKWQLLAICLAKIALKPLLLEVRLREGDG